MTYDELRQSIITWSVNDDPVFRQQIDTFIKQAENCIVTAVRLPEFSTVGAVAIAANVNTSPVPADFLAVDFLYIQGSQPLLSKEPHFIFQAFPVGVGKPRMYAMLDDKTVLWGPTPDTDYLATIGYFQQPISIVDRHEGTYISINFAAALLSGAMWKSASFMKDWTAVEVYKQEFDEALGSGSRFTYGPFKKPANEAQSSAVDGNSELGT